MERLLPICALLAACAATPAPPVDEAPAAAAPAGAAALFDLLDGDGDGALSAFEALDVLLVLSEEGESLTRDGLEARLAEAAGDELAERRDFFELGDEDRDGQVDLDELPPMFATMAAGFDADGNGALSWPEFEAADLDDPDLMVRAESAAVYAELTELLGEPARLDAVPSFLAGDLVEYDTDGDGVIALEEVEAMIRVELAGEDFEVDGTVAVMRGVINAATPARVLELAFRHPEVRTLVLADVPGSIDDVANLRAGRYLRELGFDTHVPTGGEVASGGTDLFLAGVRRSAGSSGTRRSIPSPSPGIPPPVYPVCIGNRPLKRLPRVGAHHIHASVTAAPQGPGQCQGWRSARAAAVAPPARRCPRRRRNQIRQ